MQSNALVIGCMLLCVQALSAEVTNTPPAVTVLFQKKTTLTTVQLEEKARAELSKKGVTELDQYRCAINISFTPPNVGCFVLFTRGFGKPYHHVQFNQEGKIVATYSGVMKEYLGTSRELEPEVRRVLNKEGGDLNDGERNGRGR